MDEARTPAGELPNGGVFPSTHWSVVLSAAAGGAPHAEDALARLCKAYWYPLYVFLRRRGCSPEESEDLTQEFFSRLVHKEFLAGLTQEGGKFRSFLLTALTRFVANEWSRERAQKRGGGKAVISIDADAETRYGRELADHVTPQTLFERRWALTVLDRVLARLRQEYSAAGKQELFSRLEGCLPGAQSPVAYAEAGAALDIKEATLRMAALRLRRRYGQLLRAEIAATVSSPTEIDEEIRYLIRVVGHG